MRFVGVKKYGHPEQVALSANRGDRSGAADVEKSEER